MIRWTHTEIKLLAKTFLEVRCQDMLSPVSQILEEAQRLSLPEDRRRPFPLSTLGWEIQNEIKTTLLRFGERMSAKAVIASADAVPAAQETVIPTPTISVPEQENVVVPPPVPFVIEFRIPKPEKPDLNKILESVPTAVLYGYALQRLMAHGFGNQQPQPIAPVAPAKIKTEVVQVDALAEQEPIAPTIIKAASVEDPPPSADGLRRVLVLGLLPTAQKLAQEKCVNLLRLDITWADANTRNVPPVVVDYVVLMRGVVTRFQEEQIRKRFATQDRIYHCEIGVDELMKKLIDLNSLS